MKNLFLLTIGVTLVLLTACQNNADEYSASSIKALYKAAPDGVQTRWASAENVNAEKGKGGMSNKGAKGDAYTLIAPGSTKVIFDQQGAGIITKIWSANSLLWSPENRRKVKIEMYWDNSDKPAVSVPFTDFFGIGLGLMRPFECELFASPEGRSHNCFIPMPYRKAARIEVVNESDEIIMFYYKVDFLKLNKLADDALYFHAFWHRDIKTTIGKDFEILPKVKGKGRYLGTNIGVIGDSTYRGSWFGEGEVKIFLDGDNKLPTLVGTGTEDYIGTGWGQGEYANQIQGSLVSNKEHDIYAFYRYHTVDPVYFHNDCKVTIQQIGNSQRNQLRQMRKNGADFKVVWSYVSSEGMDASKRYLDMDNPPKIEDDEFADGFSTNFYRSDDVSATAYFYLDKPASDLPAIQDKETRTKLMKEKVYQYTK
ncbi:MAG: DUF2961 domain-containing protein [Carboxylicivirga sp.]|jgi:hypothetical protein|nr:DUF2961 domain-containing protein [Carboxylicivirga sp.]